MKKVLVVLLSVIVLVASVCVFVSCSKDKTVEIASYSIEKKEYIEGDKFNAEDIAITATLTDKTEITVKSNYVLASDLSNLKLDENDCFTESGSYKVKVYKFEEREDLEIGEWEIVVSK